MLVLAHRGLPSSDVPENTLAAVRAALAAGADGVEVDVRLTADGVLVLAHDPTLARVSGLAVDVASSDWEPLRDTAGAHGLVLARVEDVLVAAAGRRVVLELKRPPGDPTAPARTAAALALQLLALQRQGLGLDVVVSSFSPALAEHARRLLPPSSGVRTALLGALSQRPAALVRRALAAGHDEVHPHHLALAAQPGAVRAARSCGVAVVPWTVNDDRSARRLARLGVDGVITDVPASARAAVVRTAAAAGPAAGPAARPAARPAA